MGLRILTNQEDNYQCLYDSVTMVAFGLVHTNEDSRLDDFIEWLPKDARRYADDELKNLYYNWLTEIENENR